MRDGWIETTLGEISTLQMGRTPSRRESSYWTEDLTYPFCTIADMDSKYVEPKREGVTNAAIRDGKAKVARKGTLLMSFKLTIGRMGFAARDIFPNEAIVMIEADESKVLNHFLYLRLASMDLTEGSGRAVKGSTLNSASIASISFLVPTLPEQKRIVDLISSVDSYIEVLQRQLESAKKSRNAVLHELLTVGGDDWEATTIGEISDFVSLRKSPKQLSSDSIYVGLEHLEPNNTSIDRFDSIRKVTSSLTPFEAGDVLFGRLRPYLHKVAIAEIFGFCSPEILVLRANAKVLPQMLLLYCDADSTIKICVERSAGTRMPRTSTEDLASIEIKLPPMPEQTKMAELFSAFDTEITETSIALEKAKVLRSSLLSDLLSGAHNIPVSYDNVVGAA